MQTLTETPKARKVNKGLRSLRIGDAVNGVRQMVITKDGERAGYSLREIAVDFGRGFELTKFDMEQANDDDKVYHVHLDAQLGDSCTCKGHIYQNKCKHVDAVKQLVSRGTL